MSMKKIRCALIIYNNVYKVILCYNVCVPGNTLKGNDAGPVYQQLDSCSEFKKSKLLPGPALSQLVVVTGSARYTHGESQRNQFSESILPRYDGLSKRIDGRSPNGYTITLASEDWSYRLLRYRFFCQT